MKPGTNARANIGDPTADHARQAAGPADPVDHHAEDPADAYAPRGASSRASGRRGASSDAVHVAPARGRSHTSDGSHGHVQRERPTPVAPPRSLPLVRRARGDAGGPWVVRLEGRETHRRRGPDPASANVPFGRDVRGGRAPGAWGGSASSGGARRDARWRTTEAGRGAVGQDPHDSMHPARGRRDARRMATSCDARSVAER